MAATALPYGQFMTDLASGVHNLSTDTDKVALLTSAYNPNYDTHASFADVSANEITGSGYTAGGVALANKALTYSATADTVSLTADPVQWAALSATCRYAVVYRSSNTAANSKLIGLIDFGADRTYAAEPFQLSFPNGVITFGKLA